MSKQINNDFSSGHSFGLSVGRTETTSEGESTTRSVSVTSGFTCNSERMYQSVEDQLAEWKKKLEALLPGEMLSRVSPETFSDGAGI